LTPSRLIGEFFCAERGGLAQKRLAKAESR
jgi:hypothetical protein